MDGARQPDEGEARPSGAAVRPARCKSLRRRARSRMAPAWSFRRRAHAAISDNTISKLLRELGIEAVPHGFRSSFRDWAAECSDAPREVCELALAHVNSDRVEAAWPDDWAERYNTTPVLIETFVETPRHTGAVYNASG